MKDLKDGIRALVRLDFQGRVHKTYRGSGIEDRYHQEVAVLKILEERNCPYVPRLLEEHPEEFRIVTTSCGAPVPQLTQKKADSLFQALERDFGVIHDDPEPRNVTYSTQLGRFCLIDFELATIIPQTSGSLDHGQKEGEIWKVRWHARTKKGGHSEGNDDFYSILGIAPGHTHIREKTGESLLDPEHTLLAISDGMGGQNAGELASRLILSWMRRSSSLIYEALAKHPEDTSALERAMHRAHLGLNEVALEDEKIRGMGATLTIAYITPAYLTMAHIGDSRLYLHRDGETRQLSTDHSIAFQEWKAGKMTEYAYRNHPRRAALYDSLGGGHEHINPQFLSLPLQHGDRLLLCSDGLVDGLSEQAIHQELCSLPPRGEIADSLLARAVANDGGDDTTLIFAEISHL